MNIDLQTVFLGVISLIMTALIPWAFLLERRLSRIEATLANGVIDVLNRLQTRLDEKSDEIQKIDKRVTVAEGILGRDILPEAERRLKIVEDDMIKVKMVVDNLSEGES